MINLYSKEELLKVVSAFYEKDETTKERLTIFQNFIENNYNDFESNKDLDIDIDGNKIVKLLLNNHNKSEENYQGILQQLDSAAKYIVQKFKSFLYKWCSGEYKYAEPLIAAPIHLIGERAQKELGIDPVITVSLICLFSFQVYHSGKKSICELINEYKN